jgi:cellulose synthase/poly-beta-1,6-N-acetylglucosamine synthase-like glycosyltransferase
MRILFWTSAALLAYAQAGYGVVLAVLARLWPRRSSPSGSAPERVALIVAAHDEEAVIEDRVRNALALDWPRERLEVVVACDGCSDATAERARAAGADRVLDLARGGKVRAQDAAVAVAVAGTELLAFSDANARWEPDALRRLADAFADERVGYACGRVSFVNPSGGGNQEGLYWRYELWLRERESAFASVTAGNGAIYAVRRSAYVHVDPIMGHDLSLPFNLVKRGWLAVYVPAACATEKMVPTVEGEFARKRRMMGHTWPIVLRGGLLDPRGYPPRYALLVASHRVLRYATPFLHLALLAASRRRRWALAPQLAVLGAAAAGRGRPGLVARYYVLTTASIALGLLDWLRHGTEAGWDPVEEAR